MIGFSTRLSSTLAALGLVAACTGSTDEAEPLDGGALDGQVTERDAQATPDGGALDGAADASGEVDGALVDGQVDPLDAQQAEDSAVVTPTGKPVFVAFGAGFWTASSCDEGRSWRLEQKSSARDDHGPWSAFARMTFANGTFVGATGWGAPGHALSSTTGRAFGNQLDAAAYVSGVGYTGSEFVLLTGPQVRRSSDGKSWGAGASANYPKGMQQLRRFRSFPELGVAIAAVETQNGTDHAIGPWLMYSTDGVKSWSEATGDFSACGKDVQQGGDIVAAGSTLLMGGPSGALCRSTDQGKSWQSAGSVPGGSLADLWSDGQSFYALANKAVYKLTGSTWQKHGSVDVSSGAGATAGSTTVVVGGAKLFYSTDLATFTPATTTQSDATTLTGPVVRDLTVGYLETPCP